MERISYFESAAKNFTFLIRKYSIKYFLVGLFCFCGIYLRFNFTLRNRNNYQQVFSKWPASNTDYGERSCLELLSDVYPSDIPEAARDPNTQFFQIIYNDTYGKPTFCEPNRATFYETFTKGLPSWKSFHLNLNKSLKSYAEQNPAKISFKFTSPKTYIQTDKIKEKYKAGDVFETTIQAIDFEGEKKRFGGDYFRARLLEVSTLNNSLPDGIPCIIEDHMNGTYTVTAPLPVPGEFKLEVNLCASVETMAAYIDWAAGRVYQGLIFKATLVTGEVVECNMDLLLYEKFKDKEICDYSNPRNNEPHFCEKPVSGNCSQIIFLTPSDDMRDKPFTLVKYLGPYFHTDQPILGYSNHIKVARGEEESVQQSFDQIRKIVANIEHLGNTSHRQPTGMGYSGQWVSFVRKYERPQAEDFAKCFSNKVVYMHGDSTMRQFFLFAAAEFKLKIYQKDEAKSYHVPRFGRNETLNISVYYRPHGLPIRLPGPPSLSPYITDSVNQIVGGKNVAIIINLGLHYIEYDPVFYIHRLVGIKKALKRHLKKYPETKIIIKGMNKSQLAKWPREWLIIRYDTILREVFKDLKQLVHVHLLDMTTLWLLTDTYHPPDNIIREQAYLIFSYICDKQY